MSEDEELFTAHDAAHLFISKFVRRLRDQHHVQVIVSTEALDESVVAVAPAKISPVSSLLSQKMSRHYALSVGHSHLPAFSTTLKIRNT